MSDGLKQVVTIEAHILSGLIRNNMDLFIGVSVYVLTAFLDVTYTIYGINTGVLYEGNPIPRFFMDWLGLKQGLIALKCIAGVLLLMACNIIYTRKTDIKYFRYLPVYLLSIAQLIAAAAWHVCLSQLPS